MDELDTSRIVPESQPELAADQEMAHLLADSSAGYRSLRRGEIVEGIVVQVGRDEILVDIGTKAEAVIPASEVGALHGDIGSVVRVGETILAMVVEQENYEGHAVLSLARAQQERGWRRLQTVFEQAESITAEVVEFNKGGVIAHIDGVRGFVPLSQIVDLRQVGSGDETTDDRLERLVGRTLNLKIIEINRSRNRLILSERAADQERRVHDRDKLVEDLEVGQVRTGRVSSIADFGAFVDLGGADGLVHITELSWTPINHPSQVVKIGDEVEVQILGVDRERKKIALSLKRLRSEPWADVPERFQVGQNVPARITKLATFGAFAEIEPGIEGLVHISELSNARIQHPKNVVTEGQEVMVKILRIEPERRRLGLSLRQAQEEIEERETETMQMVYGDPEAMIRDSTDWMGGARVIIQDELPASAPPADEPPVEPTAGEPPVEPAAGEPSVEPAAGEPSVEPAAGEPSVEPAAGEPSVEPAADEPPAEPTAGEPVALETSSSELAAAESPPGEPLDTQPSSSELTMADGAIDDGAAAPAADVTGEELAGRSPADESTSSQIR